MLRFYYQHTSCIKQQKYQMHVHISLLSVVMKTIHCHLIYIILSWALDINLNKIANYTSGCIYHLDPVLVCIQIWVGQHAQTIGLFPLLAHFLQKNSAKNFSFSISRQAQNRYGISSPYILCNLQTDIPVQCLIQRSSFTQRNFCFKR